MSIERLIYIYTLSDPITNEIRYVGKTVQKPIYRLSQHINQSKYNFKKDYCHCWIKSLLNKNLKPIMNIIEKTFDIEQECYWINKYKKIYRLTNLNPGGDLGGLGTKRTKQQIENIRIGRIKNSNFNIHELDNNFQTIKIWNNYSDISIYLSKSFQTVHSSIRKKCKINNKLFLFEKDIKIVKQFYIDKLIKVENIYTTEITNFKTWMDFKIYFKCSNKILENYLNNDKLYLNIYKITKKLNKYDKLPK